MNPTQWRPWQWHPEFASDPAWNPYGCAMVELKREEWDGKTYVVDPRELPPEFNVYGLYWRPWPVVPIRFDGP